MEGGADGMSDVVRKPCVILDGKVINIGPWDDQGGLNPMPEGAVIEEREVYQGEDGGWYVVGETRPKTPQEEINELKQLIADLSELLIENGVI